MKLSQIAGLLGCTLEGSPDIEIQGVAGIKDAGPAELTFVSNKKYLPFLKTTRAGAAIVGPGTSIAIPCLRSEHPYLAFARAIELFYQPPAPPREIHPLAVIDATARIGSSPSIGPFVFVGPDVVIGDDATLYPGVTLYTGVQLGNRVTLHSNCTIREFCRLGDRVVIQNGCVIGGDGFGFVPQEDKTYYKITQAGIVVIEDDVEVGANTTVDRAAVGQTTIRRGAKLDNLVQVGHGCVIGENSALAAQSGLAGTTLVGKNVFLGGQVGAAGHLEIGDGVMAVAQTGIAQDVAAGRVISGAPAMDLADWRRSSLIYPQLSELVKRIRALEKKVQELQQQRSLSDQ
ncbi:MAG: UDP-3-O-(3-hydroxymyristoyl)glucosamine N-acyltransferase [Acidobacteriota bacterium]